MRQPYKNRCDVLPVHGNAVASEIAYFICKYFHLWILIPDTVEICVGSIFTTLLRQGSAFEQ